MLCVLAGAVRSPTVEAIAQHSVYSTCQPPPQVLQSLQLAEPPSGTHPSTAAAIYLLLARLGVLPPPLREMALLTVLSSACIARDPLSTEHITWLIPLPDKSVGHLPELFEALLRPLEPVLVSWGNAGEETLHFCNEGLPRWLQRRDVDFLLSRARGAAHSAAPPPATFDGLSRALMTALGLPPDAFDDKPWEFKKAAPFLKKSLSRVGQSRIVGEAMSWLATAQEAYLKSPVPLGVIRLRWNGRDGLLGDAAWHAAHLIR